MTRKHVIPKHVIPAKAGISSIYLRKRLDKIPAFAGMTIASALLATFAHAEPLQHPRYYNEMENNAQNVTIIRSTGGSSRVLIRQSGNGHNQADVVQSGDDNYADIYQEGDSNDMHVDQEGDNNEVDRVQIGEPSTATIIQNGEVVEESEE